MPKCFLSVLFLMLFSLFSFHSIVREKEKEKSQLFLFKYSSLQIFNVVIVVVFLIIQHR